MNTNCILCGQVSKFYPNLTDCSIFDCPRCGHVEISNTLCAVLENNVKYYKDKQILSGIARYRTENGLKPFLFLSNNFRDLQNDEIVPKSVYEKQNLIIRYVAKKSKHPGSKVNIDVELDYNIGFCANSKEFIYLIEQLIKSNLLERSQLGGHNYILTTDGWKTIENSNTEISSNQGFIAMWFDKSLISVFLNGFAKAIDDSGFSPFRIDMKQHNNKIDDEIIKEIGKSKFLVADFTGQRGGVYFETGFALGIGIPVIWTCKKDDMINLHFDIRQFNHIDWEDENDLYNKLFKRIKETIK